MVHVGSFYPGRQAERYRPLETTTLLGSTLLPATETSLDTTAWYTTSATWAGVSSVSPAYSITYTTITLPDLQRVDNTVTEHRM